MTASWHRDAMRGARALDGGVHEMHVDHDGAKIPKFSGLAVTGSVRS
jgi:hypothetical protein